MENRKKVHMRLWQWCKDHWIDKWSIASQDWEYKILYIVMPVYQLNKFMRKNEYLNKYEDRYFTTTYEWLKVNPWEVVFMFVDQF